MMIVRDFFLIFIKFIPVPFKSIVKKLIPFSIIDELPNDISIYLKIDKKEFLKDIETGSYIKKIHGNYDDWLKNSNYYFYDLCKWHIENWFDFFLKTHFSFLKYYPKKLKILDFGSGIGTISFIYSRQNAMTLVEINQKLLDFSKWRFRRYGKNAEFYTEIPDGETYDMILLIDVIGHLTKPVEIISQICSSLKKKGLLYITFDNLLESSDSTIHRNFHINFHKILLENKMKRISKNYYTKV